MRSRLLPLVLLAILKSPAAAQQGSVEGRVGKLEADMRAVQRKVFPGGNVEPEIRLQDSAAPPAGSPASSAVADLASRVDAIEAQLARITGNVEETSFRTRRLEEGIEKLRAATEARLTRIEKQMMESSSTAPVAEPQPRPAGVSSAPRSTGDPAEDAYLAGYRLWEQGKFTEAQGALEAMAKAYPKHRRASWAMNLAGRAYLDDGKPAAAARILLGNYQENPKGERAADSLYYLGQALMKLGKQAEACEAYEELQEV
jgi:TolA-binding protein